MESYQDQILDSPSKNSYIGSYYHPPDRILLPSRVQEDPAPPPTNMNLQNITSQAYRTTPDAGSKAVIAALKTLQEKIRRLELERKQAERNVSQISQAAQSYESSTARQNQQNLPPHGSTTENTADRDGSKRKELVTQLQTAEARCQLLEKQLEYMRKMVQNAEKDRNGLVEKQASLQSQGPQSSPVGHAQLEKLERLERECLKLNRTQSVAERKMELLEQKLLEEEHERKLVQEKADELQRELETNLRLCPAVSKEVKPKKKKKSKKSGSARQNGAAAPGVPKAKRLPFVAGTSTSPSHSVHANVQSVLHMMKHHQPQLCERVRSLRRANCAARRGLHKALSSSSSSPPGPSSPRGAGPGHAAPPLGSLSDLLLALQDELGQMSFEHQELVRQIDETRGREHRDDLERELELLVRRMEEKGVQISKLRKHQETVHTLTQAPPPKARGRAASEDGGVKGGVAGAGARPPPPSPVKESSGQEGRGRAGASQENLQFLRETQRLRTSLRRDDITWER